MATSIRVPRDTAAPGLQLNLLAPRHAPIAPYRTRARLRYLPTIWLQGARLHAITERQCVATVLTEIEKGRGGSIHTMNLDHLRQFLQEPSYARRYREATIITADGMPLIWASRLRGTPLPERVTGSNLIWSLSEAAAQRGRSIYLLGGSHGTAQKAASVLAQRYPKLRIAGISGEAVEDGSDENQNRELVKALMAAKPDIVYVALGSPKQEQLIERLRDRLPSTWWLGIGVAFSFVAGEIRRAPLWMQRMGLEWLHRLIQEPQRLAKRYLVDGVPFALSLFWNSVAERRSRERS